MLSNSSSVKFSAIKVPLIFIVVLSHVNNVYNDIYFIEKSVAIITSSIVPCFFLISGYFFLKEKSLSTKLYKEKIKKRSKTLFIPYILWNIIPLLVPAILCLITSVLTNDLNKFHLYLTEIINNEAYNPIKLFWKNKVNGNAFYPANFPMWYIRDLILLIIASPILYILIQKLKISFLLICFILFISDAPFSGAVLFFSVGMFLSYIQIDIISFTHKYKKAILLSSISLFLITFYNSNLIAAKIFTIIGIFSFFSLVNIFPQRLIFTFHRLSKYSFFIYAVHAIYIYRLDDIIYKYTPNNYIFHFLSYLSVAIASCILGILIYHILKLVSTKTLSILCGNRI